MSKTEIQAKNAKRIHGVAEDLSNSTVSVLRLIWTAELDCYDSEVKEELYALIQKLKSNVKTLDEVAKTLSNDGDIDETISPKG